MTPIAPIDIPQRGYGSKREKGEKQRKGSQADGENYWVFSPSVNRSVTAQVDRTGAQGIADSEPTARRENTAEQREANSLQLCRTRSMSAKSWLFQSAHAGIILG